jgi:hypothetical protein
VAVVCVEGVSSELAGMFCATSLSPREFEFFNCSWLFTVIYYFVTLLAAPRVCQHKPHVDRCLEYIGASTARSCACVIPLGVFLLRAVLLPVSRQDNALASCITMQP